jgi:acyl carrier protein
MALERDFKAVVIAFTATERNKPARLFLESLGPLPYGRGSDGDDWVVDAEKLAALQYSAAHVAHEPKRIEHAPAKRKRIDYARIASKFRTPQGVLDAITAKKTDRRVTQPPRTDLERRLCAIWADTLHQSAVGPDENFFDLGGHSLLAVQLLSRIRRELDVEVSLESVYSGDFTVAELARAIEWKELERAGVDECQDLIDEIEKLSDEEVQALLAQEGSEFA